MSRRARQFAALRQPRPAAPTGPPPPGWHTVLDDSFARADGPPGNGWIDPLGVWSIASGVLVPSDSDYAHEVLYRPDAEFAGKDHQRATVILKSGPTGSWSAPLLWIRKPPGQVSGYVCWLSNAAGGIPKLAFGRMDASNLVNVDQFDAPGLPGAAPCIVSAEADGPTLTFSCATAADPSTPLVTFTKTDATYAGGTVGLSPLVPPDEVYRFRAEYFG